MTRGVKRGSLRDIDERIKACTDNLVALNDVAERVERMIHTEALLLDTLQRERKRLEGERAVVVG